MVRREGSFKEIGRKTILSHAIKSILFLEKLLLKSLEK